MRIAHFFSGNPTSGAASGTLNLCKGLIKENVDIEIFNDKFDFFIQDNKILYKKNYIKNFFRFSITFMTDQPFLVIKKI